MGNGECRYCGGRRTDDVRLVGRIAGGGDSEHAELGCAIHRRGQIVVEGLAVVRTERHVDDVDSVIRVAIAVRVDGELHSLDERDAIARRCRGGANLDGVQLHVGRDALVSADDVGHMRSVAAGCRRIRCPDRIGILRAGCVGPLLADEVETADDFRGRKQVVCRRVARISRKTCPTQQCRPRGCPHRRSAACV